MKNTQVIAHLNKQISTENLIYCSTFQLAWNELSNFLKGTVSINEASFIVDELNKKLFTKEYLDESCYLAYADLISSGILDRIKTNLMQKFKETSKLDIDPNSFRPSDILAYAFLLKILMFEKKFEEVNSLYFDGTRVEAFGFEKLKKDTEKKLRNQALVLYYRDSNDFSVSLRTKTQDYIILAKTSPKNTLRETLSEVQSKMWDTPDYLKEEEMLHIPKMDLDLEHHYNELISKTVFVDSKVTEYFISDAVQFIKFTLNEEGAKLRSETALTLRGCAINLEIRKFIFNKPFLFYLTQEKTAPPYFVAWVANTEIMKPKQRANSIRADV